MTSLYWLPEATDFRTRARALMTAENPWNEAVALANTRMDFVATNMLDSVLAKALGGKAPQGVGAPVRLAILSSSTTTHLHASLRVAGLRRGIPVEIYENNYGQYWQELADQTSDLHRFKPTHVLFALDAFHLTQGIDAAMTVAEAEAAFADVQNRLKQYWALARDAFKCPVLVQTVLPVHPAVLGSNEQNLPGSRNRFITRLNAALRDLAQSEGVHLVAVDAQVQQDGLKAWFDAALWHRSKQEISLPAAPLYGDLVLRLVAAQLGRSAKCLVLDLDHTVWGGVVGDDGVEGLILGQGSALGEAYVAFQDYTRELSRRGIILAVCSKNDEANAIEPFNVHPEMILKRENIACFVANWNDKASNIRSIAEQLNIGIDSLVFVDDNPFERTLVRQELPMVAVPEVGDDPTIFPQLLADAGYFEGLTVTAEDRERSAQYQGNLQRDVLRSSATDLPSYLRALEMKLIWRPFDQIGLARTAQLINKTNQFNLTTRRKSEDDVLEVINDQRAAGLQLRLLDRFGDNGIIAIIIGKLVNDDDFAIDTWLMSCRVLGRQVEPTTLNLIVAQAKLLGAKRVLGEYIPTKKNAMVKDHYLRLGFTQTAETAAGARHYTLDLGTFSPEDTFIHVEEG